ncbi:ribosome-associated translation inhibitor RaiA [Candidatus Babeliales bacterium]|nr:ribosome-associated translation inhibitor RaiA [Candidatus Babeliales bacterium]
MELEIIFRGIDPSEALEKYVAKYFTKFKKYLGRQDPSSIFLHVVLDGQFNHHLNQVEARVKTQEFDLIAKRQGPEMYPLIDEVMHIMEHDLQKAKQRKVDDVKKRKKLAL